MYQYSMTQWIVGNEDIERSMARLRKFGYDGIEFAAEAEMLDSSRLKALMQKYGLVCTSLCGIFTENRDLTAPAGEKAEEAVAYICRNVDFAVEVGAPYIIVVPSPVGRTEIPKGCTYQQMWENSIKNIRIAADYAAEHHVKLAIEAINRYETYFVNTINKAYRLVKEIDHPAVYIMADLFHMSLEERDINAALHRIADKLIHVHIADNTREAAGLGNTDFKSILNTLKQIGYCGPLTMEFMPRVSNPYSAGEMDTMSQMMDYYAQQAIQYMRMMEKSITPESM